MDFPKFLTMLNEFVPNKKVSIAVAIIGLLSTFSCMFGIEIYNKPKLQTDGKSVGKPFKYWLLWFYAILFILVTLVGLYGVYHNYTH